MEEASNRSSGAPPVKASVNSEASEEGGAGNREEKAEKFDEQRRVSSDSSSGCALGNSSKGESEASKFQTLASSELSAADLRADFDDSSDQLSGSVCVFIPLFFLGSVVCSVCVVNGVLNSILAELRVHRRVGLHV